MSIPHLAGHPYPGNNGIIPHTAPLPGMANVYLNGHIRIGVGGRIIPHGEDRRTHPCPACDEPSVYHWASGRYFHLDGTRNDPCWLSVHDGPPMTRRDPQGSRLLTSI